MGMPGKAPEIIHVVVVCGGVSLGVEGGWWCCPEIEKVPVKLGTR